MEVLQPHTLLLITVLSVAMSLLHVMASMDCQPWRLKSPENGLKTADQVASIQPQETQDFLKQLTRLVGHAETSTQTGCGTPALFHEVSHSLPQQSSVLSLSLAYKCQD